VKLKPSNNKEIDKIISYETKELEKILSKTK
jgi:hypothetical protein